MALLRWDFVMQFRYGFWVAGVVVTFVWAAVFWPLSDEYLDLWLPFVLYADIAAIGLMFVAGVLFFDRRQGVIEALAVSPMPTTAWLLSKVLSLTLLCTAVACGLVFLLRGAGVGWGRVIVAFALSAAVFTLLGFIVASRFDSVSSFLTFFALISIPTALPVLDYFGVWSHPALWLLPFQPALVAMREAFRPSDPAAFALALGLLLGWTVVGFRLGLVAFDRWVTGRQGSA